MSQTDSRVISEAGIHFFNSFTYSTPEIKDKINYFVDCIDFLAESQGRFLCSININTRLLCKGLKKILLCQSSRRWKYFKHYYEHSSHLLSPDFIINCKYYSTDFQTLSISISKYLSDAKKENESIGDLIAIITKIENELDNSYFENVISEVSKAVLCSKDIHQHNHKEIIEKCAEILIAEFYSIGWDKHDLHTVFETAVMYNRSFIEELKESNIYKIPVPPNIYEQKKLPFPEYKNLVIGYLQNSTLPDQFKNLIFIYKQAVCKKNFVFKVRNLWFADESKFTYGDVIISKLVLEKYTSDSTKEKYKEFFKEAKNTSFCEVSVVSGNNIDALQKAIVKANEALNYINFNLGSAATKANLDLSKYVLNDETIANCIGKSPIVLNQDDEKHLKYLHDLNALKEKPAINFYCETDKIFFAAYSESTTTATISSIWRYFESLFLNEKKAKEVMERLAYYYVKKSDQQHTIGPFMMVQMFAGDYWHKQRQAELGMDSDTFLSMENTGKTYTNYITDWNKYIKHPIINSAIDKTLELSELNRHKALYHHFKRILKSAYIQRNLYQHSNIIIEELQGIWFERLVDFAGSLRLYIIDDLKANPDIISVEGLFPTPPSDFSQ